MTRQTAPVTAVPGAVIVEALKAAITAVPEAEITAVPEAAVTAAPEAVTMTAPEAVITITTIITTTVHGAEASSGSRLTRTKPFELNFLNQK